MPHDSNHIPESELEKIRDALPVSAVVSPHVKLEKRGDEFKGLCPFHNEKTASFSVNDDKGFFHCFGCGAHGDVIEFEKRFHNVDFLEAVARLNLEIGQAPTAPAPKKPDRPTWTPILPVPEDAPNPPTAHFNHGALSVRWEYKDAHGARLGYTCRFDITPTHKEVVPLTFCSNGAGRREWRWLSFPKPRPLDGLDWLDNFPGLQVIVVEGEKCRRALQPLFLGKFVVVTWPGGTGAVKHTDWSPLADRKIIIWPDWDLKGYTEKHAKFGQLMPTHEQAGMKAALTIAEIVAPTALGVRIAMPPADKPDGWDCADAIQKEGWDAAAVMAFLRASVIEPDKVAGVAPSRSSDASDAGAEREGKDDAWRDRVIWKDDARDKLDPKALTNAVMLLTYHPACAGLLSLDEFTGLPRITRRPPWETDPHAAYPHDVTDADEGRATCWLEGLGLRQNTAQVGIAMRLAAETRRVDSLRDFLTSLRWDGIARLANWLHAYLGAPDDAYHAEIGMRFLIGLVARGMRPGCQMDNVLVLSGPQGCGKTTACQILGGPFYRDGLPSLDAKDAIIGLRRWWLVELNEMSAIRKAQLERVKAFLTTRIDTYRPPYGRNDVEQPRRCAFIATVDVDEFLNDPAGNRRFWPATVTRLDREALARDRPQLIAEAVDMLNAGERWTIDPDLQRTVVERQEAATEIDPWEPIVALFLESRTQVSTGEVLDQALQHSPKDLKGAEAKRVAGILRRFRWTRHAVRIGRRGGVKVWRRPESDHLQLVFDAADHRTMET